MKILLTYNSSLVDTDLGQDIVLADMVSVMVEMIVLTALMKDKIFVVSSPNSGWTPKLFFLSLGRGAKEGMGGSALLMHVLCQC